MYGKHEWDIWLFTKIKKALPNTRLFEGLIVWNVFTCEYHKKSPT
jgi:hypothetical protein